LPAGNKIFGRRMELKGMGGNTGGEDPEGRSLLALLGQPLVIEALVDVVGREAKLERHFYFPFVICYPSAFSFF
jgi:hypothetical protein